MLLLIMPISDLLEDCFDDFINRTFHISCKFLVNIFIIKLVFCRYKLFLSVPHNNYRSLISLFNNYQGVGREKHGNHGKFISSNLIFCYKEFENFAWCKSVFQSETEFVVHSEPIESGLNLIFHNGSTSKI